MGELFSDLSGGIADEGTGVIPHTFCGQQIVGAEEIRGLYRSADLLAQDASEGIIYGGAGLVVPTGARNGSQIVYRSRAVPFRNAGMGSGRAAGTVESGAVEMGNIGFGAVFLPAFAETAEFGGATRYHRYLALKK